MPSQIDNAEKQVAVLLLDLFRDARIFRFFKLRDFFVYLAVHAVGAVPVKADARRLFLYFFTFTQFSV